MIGGWYPDQNEPESQSYKNTVFKLDLEEANWHQLPSMSQRHCELATVLFRDKILGLGGTDEYSRVEQFDLQTNQWSNLPSMSSPPGNLADLLHSDQVYAIGRFGFEVEANTEFYNPVAGGWSAGPTLTTRRIGAVTVSLGGRVYILGGYGADQTQRLRSVEGFSPRSRQPTWHSVPDISTPRFSFAVAVLVGKILVMGGCYGFELPTGKSEEFCPASNTWTDLPDMKVKRAAMGQAVALTRDNMPNRPTILT